LSIAVVQEYTNIQTYSIMCRTQWKVSQLNVVDSALCIVNALQRCCWCHDFCDSLVSVVHCQQLLHFHCDQFIVSVAHSS